ncbi:hypothetical protein LEP1GSC082_1855 [Leptospira kirschneri str. H2]|uniref:Uncharacterized protein n=2 Tax=Leptospira kirschneri TaxID=29507 RepID=A0A0E2B1H2_9LEPT|nr:hypothetical protein LEP1GSC081_4432 [Leptospira kirschneri str. H1]EKO60915.1 hypothetical protein LEP1GSC082_1855 [Leptospira kirschneri str. H2]EMK25518.1 hypothetical protein LEP1GSC008_0757 [Leptospira kirschneri serovar Bulgarica str. Nikolaevo]
MRKTLKRNGRNLIFQQIESKGYVFLKIVVPTFQTSRK